MIFDMQKNKNEIFYSEMTEEDLANGQIYGHFCANL